MPLTSAQNTALKAAIIADPVLNAFPNTLDGAFGIRDKLVEQAVPVFVVYRSRVPIGEIGEGFISSEVGGLSTANTNRLIALAHYLLNGINPSVAGNRAFFDDIFGNNSLTGVSLSAVWRRPATYIEKIFASSAIGTTAAPATLLFERRIDPQEILTARNSP